MMKRQIHDQLVSDAAMLACSVPTSVPWRICCSWALGAWALIATNPLAAVLAQRSAVAPTASLVPLARFPIWSFQAHRHMLLPASDTDGVPAAGGSGSLSGTSRARSGPRKSRPHCFRNASTPTAAKSSRAPCCTDRELSRLRLVKSGGWSVISNWAAPHRRPWRAGLRRRVDRHLETAGSPLLLRPDVGRSDHPAPL